MPLHYEISANITRDRALELINRLAEEPDFRERFQADARAILAEYEIEVGAETLPEQVRLPEPDAIRAFRSLLEAGLAPETDSPYTDSPYSVAILLLALGAMPVLAGDRPSLDGTG
jgi:hypothetical protein